MSKWMLYAVSVLIAYCLGSISTGLLVSKLLHGPDLRTVGSKNTGATNVQRVMGWGPGLLTFAGDSLKAVLACWIGEMITGSHNGALLCGAFVVLGHNWPVFFHFKGGKGVASSCGVMVYCFPVPALICFALGIAIILITKYVSLASMSLLVLYAILVSVHWGVGDYRVILWAWMLAALCLIRHHANINRLIHGKENKLGQKKAVSQ